MNDETRAALRGAIVALNHARTVLTHAANDALSRLPEGDYADDVSGYLMGSAPSWGEAAPWKKTGSVSTTNPFPPIGPDGRASAQRIGIPPGGGMPGAITS
jgi:hypothetical protein